MDLEYEKLVQEVYIRPDLYNEDSPQYSNRNTQETLWNEVAKALDCPAVLCRKQWQSLRNSYARELRLEKSTAKKKKKRWYLSDVMEFLRPYMKKRNITSNVPSRKGQAAEEVLFTLPTNVAQQLNDSPLPDSEKSIPSKVPESDGLPCSRCSQNSKSTVKNAKLLYRVNEAITSTQKSSVDLENDPDRQFLLSLLPDVKKLADNKRRKLKRRFLELLDEALDA